MCDPNYTLKLVHCELPHREEDYDEQPPEQNRIVVCAEVHNTDAGSTSVSDKAKPTQLVSKPKAVTPESNDSNKNCTIKFNETNEKVSNKRYTAQRLNEIIVDQQYNDDNSDWETEASSSDSEEDTIYEIKFLQYQPTIAYDRPVMYFERHDTVLPHNNATNSNLGTAKNDFEQLDLQHTSVADWIDNYMFSNDDDSECEVDEQPRFEKHLSCESLINLGNTCLNKEISYEPSTKQDVKFVQLDDIKEALLEEKVECLDIPIHPIVSVKIGKINLSAVLDSGSPVSVISEVTFKKYQNLLNGPILPLHCTKIRGVISSKPVEIRQQTYAEFLCQGHLFSANLLIVPRLTTQIILGVDFLSKYKVILDFNTACATAFVQENAIQIKFEDWITRYEEGASCLKFLSISNATQDVKPDDDITDKHFQTERIDLISDIIKKKLVEVEGASERDKEELFLILRRYSRVFANSPGTIKNFLYEFKIKEHNKFFVPPYPIPIVYRERVKAEIQSMLSQGIIEPAVSSYNSPLHIVEKRDKSIRLVLDSRQINTIILPETDRPQTLEELLQKFYGVKVLSSLDLRSSF